MRGELIDNHSYLNDSRTIRRYNVIDKMDNLMPRCTNGDWWLLDFFSYARRRNLNYQTSLNGFLIE